MKSIICFVLFTKRVVLKGNGDLVGKRVEMRKMMPEQLFLWAFCSEIENYKLLVSNRGQSFKMSFVKSGGDGTEKKVSFTGSPRVRYCFIVCLLVNMLPTY